MNLSLKPLYKLQVAAGHAWGSWYSANQYALSAHAGYVAALSANNDAQAAFQAVYNEAQKDIDLLMSDPETDQSWYDPKNQKLPVWLRDNAYARLNELGAGKLALIQDMAAHLQIQPEVAALDPAAVAKAADEAAKAPPPPWHPNVSAWTPNAATPDAQDPRHPPADVPPVPEQSTPWLVIGGLAAAALIAIRVLVR